MLVGLQGSGKTTTAAKIARRLADRAEAESADGLARHAPPGGAGAVAGARRAGRHRHAADRRRPDRRSRSPARAITAGAPRRLRRRHPRHRRPHPYRRAADGRDGRDQARRPTRTRSCSSPTALTGQDAVNLAKSFDERVGITGIVLTRVDGDGRGGAALSMRAVTGKPIKLIGTGEKLDALEDFDPGAHRRPHPRHGRHRRPGREGGRRTSTPRRRPKAAERMRKGVFDLDDLAEQLQPDAEDRRHVGRDGHAARRRQDEEADRRAWASTIPSSAPGGDHLVDDARPSARTPTSSRRAARSASPPAPARRSRRSTSSSRCTARWPT